MQIEHSFNNIRIVLVEPTHPGNIGAVARAMKVMGLEQLCLVNPKLFPHEEATARATQAVDILEKARVVQTFDEAISDCVLVLGTSARVRALSCPMLNARAAAPLALQEAVDSPVAILFGREKSGLSNDELQRCHYHIEIPTNPEYSSLNIAAAVQIVCYELRMALGGVNTAATKQADEFATAEEVEGFYTHLEKVLFEINYINPAIPDQVMKRLRRLFSRARLEKLELNILRGILTAVQKHYKK